MQPSDKLIVSTLKSHYSEKIREWMLLNERAVTAFDIMEIFRQAIIKSPTAEIEIHESQG